MDKCKICEEPLLDTLAIATGYCNEHRPVNSGSTAEEFK